MITGIMQPYFFPYIGYFQLIAHCDIFVLHDDVQYIKGGWINRNRILMNHRAVWITFPVLRAAHQLPIHDRYYSSDPEDRNRLLRRIGAAYRTAPSFDQIYPLIEEIMGFGNTNVAAFNSNLIQRMAAHLKLRTPFVLSSKLPKDDSLTGEDRVIEICRCLGGTHYVNPIRGRGLYRRDAFSRVGIELKFLESAGLGLAEPGDPSLRLSIIDDLMHRGEGALADALKAYRLAA
jgi:WbqC-like protein family